MPTAAGVHGQLRVLYVLATWESTPTPFTRADVERVAAETDAFFRASSSGRLSTPGTVAGPILIPPEYFDVCDPAALRLLTPNPLLAGYDRVVFVTPYVEGCGEVRGAAKWSEALLNGELFRGLAVHELGHTLGLDHASRWECALTCGIEEYGNAFSPMGSGDSDFNAFEKWRLGWLSGVVRPRRAASYELGSIDRPTKLPQALVVRTAGGEFWFESRGLATGSFKDGSVQPPGVAVIAALPPDAEVSYPRDNLLLPNPSGGARYAYSTGESFVQPRVFEVTVERHTPQGASLRFEWLDRRAPAKPRLRAQATGRGRISATWKAAPERGSGVAAYTVVVDGRAVRRLSREFPPARWEATLRLSPGWHRIGVLATDRAGNRGRPALVRVRVE